MLILIILKSFGALPRTYVFDTFGPKHTLKNKSLAFFKRSPFIEFIVI